MSFVAQAGHGELNETGLVDILSPNAIITRVGSQRNPISTQFEIDCTWAIKIAFPLVSDIESVISRIS